MKRLFQWLRASMLVCATVWLVSCSNDDYAVIEPGAAYRAVLRGLDWGQNTTFVYGHKTPDVDAVCSSLGYAKLMRALGYNCKAKVSGPINRETQYIAQRFGFDVPELKTAVPTGTRLILTDHTDYAQCVDGAREATILQKIDHHVDGDIKDIILQEMGNLDGILIATTNLAQNMDKAFERRFLYKIKFEKPTVEARMSMWHEMIPYLKEEDTRILAIKHEFSGGQIENIARHYTIGNILHGKSENVIEELSAYCDNERLETKGIRKIGF